MNRALRLKPQRQTPYLSSSQINYPIRLGPDCSCSQAPYPHVHTSQLALLYQPSTGLTQLPTSRMLTTTSARSQTAGDTSKASTEAPSRASELAENRDPHEPSTQS